MLSAAGPRPRAIESPRLGRRAVRAVASQVLPASVVVWHGSRRLPRIALTFDDGPGDLTPAYLDVLAQHGARATFFVVGERCERERELLSRIREGSHELGVHGYTHKSFTALRGAKLADELERTWALLPGAAPEKRLVRPPYGDVSLASLWACARAGFTTVLWSRDSDDCRTEDWEKVVRNVSPGAVQSGDIVLLHDGQAWTLRALGALLARLKESGHELVTVGQLLDG